MKNWNDIKYTYHLTGAELLPIIQEGKERTITLKELIDKILSYSKPMENEWGIPPFNPLDKQVYKNKEDIGRLKGAVNKVAEESELAYVAANKAWDLTTENEELVREALKSAKKAERELVSLKQLEYKVDENYSKILGLEVSIKEEYSSSGQYVIYKFYQGDILLTTVRIPATLVYKGSDYIGIDSFNTIYLLKDKFEADYIEPLRETDSRLLTKIQQEIDRATAKETEIDETLTVHETAINERVKISDLEGDTYNISSLFNGVEYNEPTKQIRFKHGDTILAVIDATQFIKDGFISDVRIETIDGESCLVIDFNTDSGIQDIAIPLTKLIEQIIKVVDDDAELTEPGIYKRKSSNELIFKESNSQTTITSEGLETVLYFGEDDLKFNTLKAVKLEDLDTITSSGVYVVLEYNSIPVENQYSITYNANILEVNTSTTGGPLSLIHHVTQKFKGKVRECTYTRTTPITWSEWSDPYLDIIEENEEVTAAALVDLDSRINAIPANVVKFTTYPVSATLANNTVYTGTLPVTGSVILTLPEPEDAHTMQIVGIVKVPNNWTGTFQVTAVESNIQVSSGYTIEPGDTIEFSAIYADQWYISYTKYV